MPVQGVPAFNAIAVLQIEEVDFHREGGPRLVAHGAFINTRTGVTYGKTTCAQWSKETMGKLEEFRAALEKDLAALVFEQEATPSLRTDSAPEPGGIGEHLIETPSI